KGVQISDPNIVRQARLGTHPQTVPDRHPVQNSANRGTPAQMAGDDQQVRFANRCLSSVHVKLLAALRVVFAPEQLSDTLGDIFVACAMKSPTPDAQVVPGL